MDFQRIFEGAPALLLVVRADPPRFTILAASDAYCEATFTERASIVGRPLFDVFPDDPVGGRASGPVNLRASLERAIESRQRDAMALQRYSVQRPDGSFEVRYWAPVNMPVLDDGGAVSMLIHRVEDVTAWIEARDTERERRVEASDLESQLVQLDAEIYNRTQELLAARRELEVRAGELDRFALRIAHDLKNPLAALALRLEATAWRLEPDSPAAESLRSMQRQLLRMNDLVEGLLAFSRAGAQPVPGACARLEEVLGGVLSDLGPQAEAAHVELRTEPLPDVLVAIAPGVLTSVVVNLVRNAVHALEAVPPDDRRIIVRGLSSGDMVRVELEDSGPGIPSELLEEIFLPYVRGPASGREGLGIGLATVERIVQAHGGRVGVHTRPGAGSTFWFELPLT